MNKNYQGKVTKNEYGHSNIDLIGIPIDFFSRTQAEINKVSFLAIKEKVQVRYLLCLSRILSC